MANETQASIGDALIFMTKAAAACLVAAFALVLLWLWGMTASQEELSRARALNKVNEAQILRLKEQVDACVQLLTSLTDTEAAALANPYEARLQELLGNACRGRVDEHPPAWTPPPDDPIVGESGPWERYQTPSAEAPKP